MEQHPGYIQGGIYEPVVMPVTETGISDDWVPDVPEVPPDLVPASGYRFGFDQAIAGGVKDADGVWKFNRFQSSEAGYCFTCLSPMIWNQGMVDHALFGAVAS